MALPMLVGNASNFRGRRQHVEFVEAIVRPRCRGPRCRRALAGERRPAQVLDGSASAWKDRARRWPRTTSQRSSIHVLACFLAAYNDKLSMDQKRSGL
jgi:hypothetical protein